MIPQTDMGIGHFWKWNYGDSTRGTDKYCDASIEYFNSEDATLESIGNKYGVTRERIRQHLEKEKQWIYEVFFKSSEGCKLFRTVKEAADRVTEISLLNVKDEEFTSAGICRLMVSLFPDEFKIVKDPRLNGEWIVSKELGFIQLLDVLVEELNTRPYPMKVADVLNLFPINEDVLMSLNGIMEKDGYVTLESNKEASRTGTPQKIFDFLERIGRPALVSEIVEKTGLNEGQVRTVLSVDDNFSNVGRSLYELSEADYSDYEIVDLAKNYIVGNQKAMKIEAVIEYVKIYIDASDGEILKEILRNPEIFGSVKGYIYLTEFGPESIKIVSKKKYEIPLDEAILGIINESDEIFETERLQEALGEKYGGKASTNLHSIEATLVTLCADGKITRVGGDKTGCYRRNKMV